MPVATYFSSSSPTSPSSTMSSLTSSSSYLGPQSHRLAMVQSCLGYLQIDVVMMKTIVIKIMNEEFYQVWGKVHAHFLVSSSPGSAQLSDAAWTNNHDVVYLYCHQHYNNHLGFLVLNGRSKLCKEVMHLFRKCLKRTRNIITFYLRIKCTL